MIRSRAFGLALLLLLVALPAIASTRYDPRLRFRTISTPLFDIHFHQGEELQARRLAVIAEEVARDLAATLGRPSGRVQVILVNQSDVPNGWATPVPYNVIEITAAAPVGDSTIGNTDDWLRLVFAHEYTHVVHLGQSRGWFAGLRRVFGRMPVLFPNLFAPLWQIEGLATYEESALTGQGRVHGRDFRAIAVRAAGSQRMTLDRASGGLVDWPAGDAPYVYGAYFHEFLARRYGPESLRRLTETTSRGLPYFGPTGYGRVFGKPLGQLWREFQADVRRDADGAVSSTAVRLTHHGFNVSAPRFAPSGEIVYSVVNPNGFPSLMSIPTAGGRPRQIATRYLGARVGFAGGLVVFDQRQVVRHVGLQSDLYTVPARGGSVRRLTREARATDPDVSPDGRTIVCAIQRADGRGLALMDLSPDRHGSNTRIVTAEPLADWSSPRWSPDGRRIAAERRAPGRLPEIVSIEVETGRMQLLSAHHAARSVSPTWSPDGRRLLFSSDREGRRFSIYSVDVTSGRLSRLEGTGISAMAPDVSPDGRWLAYVGYTEDGEDLFLLPLDSARWTDVAEGTPVPTPPSVHVPEADPKDYSPWRSLLPRFWTPTLESDAGEGVLGAATGGLDALGRHAYGAEVGWAAARARPDWQIGYAYDRWWPTLFGNVSDDTDPFRDGELRTREVNAGAVLPFRRVRWSQSLLAAFHFSRDRATCSRCGTTGELTSSRGAVRAGWLVDWARAYGYSIGEEEGVRIGVTTELTREGLGGDGNGGAASADARAYVPIGRSHAVLAFRGAGATTWGDEAVRRVFSASGSGAEPLNFEFGSDAIGLLRGLEEAEIAGEHAAVVNVDLRIPLRRIQRGVGTLPLFVRTLHGAAFLDVGHAWDDGFRARDVSRSGGLELSADLVVGHVLPVTITAGAAWRDAGRRERGLVAFTRIGRAF